MSSGSPNWSGFTKMLTATTSHSALARVDQRRVPVVQRAHGGHQPDHPARGAGPVQHGAAAGDGLDDLHRDCSYTAAGSAGAVASRRGIRGGGIEACRPGEASAWASRVARAAPAW